MLKPIVNIDTPECKYRLHFQAMWKAVDLHWTLLNRFIKFILASCK